MAIDPSHFNDRMQGTLSTLLGLRIVEASPDRVRARVRVPCDVVHGGEHEVLARLGDVDVLVSMAFTREMATAAPRLRLVQVPGAGLDRVDRGALGPGTALANAYGHDVGIA